MTSDTMPALRGQAIQLYALINSAVNPEQIDGAVKLIYRGVADGRLDDAEADYLSSCAQRRRPAEPGLENLPVVTSLSGPLCAPVPPFTTLFEPRRYKRAPSLEASRCRRRVLGGSGAMPHALRHLYTEAQRSVLCVIAGQIKRQGICDLPIDKIAACAGVCRTTVQTTIRLARTNDHLAVMERPQRGRKHLTSIVTISSPEWLAWVRRAPSAASGIGFKSVFKVHPTKNTVIKRKETGRAFEVVEWWRGHGPPIQTGTASRRIMEGRDKRWRSMP